MRRAGVPRHLVARSGGEQGHPRGAALGVGHTRGRRVLWQKLEGEKGKTKLQKKLDSCSYEKNEALL